MDSLFGQYLEGYADYLAEIIGLGVQMLVGGVLLPFLGWAIGYAVYSIFTWLNSWTR